MTYTAQTQTENPLLTDDTYVQLLTTQTVKDVNGNDVQIPQLVGSFSVNQLNTQIADLQAKLNAVQAVITPVTPS
jgi:hypothetical protein